MDLNSDARAIMHRWRNSVKSKERRIFRFDERVSLQLDAIHDRMVTQREPLSEWQIKQVYFRDLDKYEPIDAEWRTICVGDIWGGKEVSAFFRREITIPASMAGQRVTLRFYIGGDSLLRLDGVPYHGLDPFRSAVVLTESAQGGETLTVEVEAYVHWHSGEGNLNTFQQAELLVTDAEIEAVYWDFVAAFKVLAMNDIDTKLEAFLIQHLSNALKVIPLYDPDFEAFKSGCLQAQAMLRESVYQTDRFKGSGLLHLVGHSHLDIVFMWPYREFVRKVGRTHATMLRLMEQYPEFKFSQSQAKLYADMKQHYPELYEQVKQRIAEGRWQAVGAFWVEPDCNLISGESFVRQIIYGQRFWQEEFDIQSHTCWQPDVFGLSWAMPQILARSGIDTIMTNKMFVWNDTNRWTQNTFWWEGMDGSRVLGVVPPGHFIGMVDPDHMDNHWRDFSDKETIGESLYCYGWGDGGGGVDPEMLECAVRYRDFPGLVPTTFSLAEKALDGIGARAVATDLPVWRDELYLEAHRGVFTNKARLKKLNRRAEFLYREAELLAAWAWLDGCDYPQQQLDDGWRMLLTTQFHDSLPGTHINEAYPQLLAEYDELTAIAEQVRDDASNVVFGANDADTDSDQLLVFNSLSHFRADTLAIDAEMVGDRIVCDAEAEPLLQQRITTLDGKTQVVVKLPGIPAVGSVRLQLREGTPEWTGNVHAAERTLENEYLRAEFNDDGELISLWDKEHHREILIPGEVGNHFQIYGDQPGKYDAWDIIAQYTEYEIDISGGGTLTVDETGPLRASLRLEKSLLNSTLVQRISLYAGSRQLVFETMIDWVERQKLLKVGFPVEISTRAATYDIAYGNMERPTHRNTSYDAARFEVPAHLWMDMSENGYGVALLNDCKYGHEAHGKWMRLTLLKGSIYPDPYADMETHHFKYVLYPHASDWRQAHVHDAALELNVPPRIVDGGAQSTRQFIRCDEPNITLEAVKRSEDGAHLIVRLVERHNTLTQARLTFDRPVEAGWTCDLMERIESALEPEGAQVQTALKPYEVVTLRVQLQRGSAL